MMDQDPVTQSEPPTIDLGKPEAAVPAALVPARQTSPVKPAGALVLVEHARTKPRLYVVLGLAVLVAVVVAAGLWLLRPTAVTVVQATRGPAVEAVYGTGTVEPTVMIPIAGRIAARLAQLYVDEGATVKKGDMLVRFEDQDLQSALKELQAREDFAKQEFDRTAKLAEGGTVARSVYDRAYADWQAAKSATFRASTEASFLRLVSPVDGRVVRRDGEVGQLIPANQTVLWLAEDKPLRISSEIDEEDIARVAVGQDVLIRADAFAGKVFHGRVQSITPMGDSVARSYRVRIELAEDTPLLIGMTAEANISIGEHKDAILLPASAVHDGKVWRIADGRLQEQPVEVGIKGSDKVEILSGVSLDDKIALAPDTAFKPGMRVRAEPAASQ
jgi:multidrug efflux system membrane fusion protein